MSFLRHATRRTRLSHLQAALEHRTAQAPPLHTHHSRALSSSPSHDHSTGGSRHRQWYRQFVPAMIPIAVLASAVYLGLHLTRDYLSHEKYLELAEAHIKELEAELAALRNSQQNSPLPPTAGTTQSESSVHQPSSSSSRWGWARAS